MGADQLARLRAATRTGRPLGSDRFVHKLETRLKRTLQPKKRGRTSRHLLTAAAN